MCLLYKSHAFLEQHYATESKCLGYSCSEAKPLVSAELQVVSLEQEMVIVLADCSGKRKISLVTLPC